MKIHLRATIIATAIAATFAVINRVLQFLPLSEWLTEDDYVAYGLYHSIVSVYMGICIVMVGLALYQNRSKLFVLSPVMKVQAWILVGMIVVNAMWHIIYYCIGAENIDKIYSQIGAWWFNVELVLLMAWLWQLAFSRSRLLQSKLVGNIGLISSCVFIVATIVWLGSVILTAVHNPDSLVNINNVLAGIYATFREFLFALLIGSYCYASHCASLGVDAPTE